MDNESREMFQKLFDKLDIMDGRLDKMDGRLNKVEGRLEILEIMQDRTAKKLDDLQLDIAVAQRNTRHDIHDLKDEMETVIEVLKMNNLLTIQ